MQIRAAAADRVPSLAAIQLAAGPIARIMPAGEDEHFLLAPVDPGALGLAISRLVSAGFDIVSCRQAHSEMEEAFLSLTGAVA